MARSSIAIILAATSSLGCVQVLGLHEGHETSGTSPVFSAPIELAKGGDPRGIAVDEGSVYWADHESATIFAIGKAAGEAKRVVVVVDDLAHQAPPREIGIDSQYVYFTAMDDETCSGSVYLIGRAPIGGGALDQAFSTADVGSQMQSGSGCSDPTRFSLDASNLYITIEGAEADFLFQEGKEGSPSILATIQSGMVAVAPAGQYVFWADPSAGRIVRVKRPSGPTEVFVEQQAGPQDLAADDAFLYWVNDGGTVMKLAIESPGAPPTELASLQRSPARLALAPDALYWTNEGDGSIATVLKTGGATTIVATGQKSPKTIAADQAGVYWINTGEPAVMMATR